MTGEQVSIHFPPGAEEAPTPLRSTGILPAQEMRALIREKVLFSTAALISEEQIQPSSIDLRLGPLAYRVRASFLPGRHFRVEDKLEALATHKIDLTNGAVLERGCVYIVPLLEHVRLGKRLSGVANPKSSTGRLDIFTRLITDNGSEFDRVREAYKGPLYAEISPRTFSVLVRRGSRLSQLRFRRGSPRPTDTGMQRLHEETRLVHGEGEAAHRIAGGVPVTVDLRGETLGGLIGYKAKAHTDIVDVDRHNHYDPSDYWEPILANRDGNLILDPDAFYILVSKEAVTVPPDHAAEMAAFNPLQGEFRAHYAGFFDPGFGYSEAGGEGSRAVLEVRSYEVPFLLEHGQVVARLTYERLTMIPDRLYGSGIGSSYQRQGLALSKHFKR